MLLISCQTTDKDKVRKVTVYDYQIWPSDLNKKELRDSLVLYVDSIIFKNHVNYVYHDSMWGDSTYRYRYSIQNDSIFYSDEYCRLLDTIYLDYKTGQIEMYRSDYDEKNSQDEESYIYWNQKYGLISVYNYSCGALILFDYEEIESFAKNNVYDYIINEERELHKEIYEDMLKWKLNKEK